MGGQGAAVRLIVMEGIVRVVQQAKIRVGISVPVEAGSGGRRRKTDIFS